MIKSVAKKLFIDVGPGTKNSEAWHMVEKGFTIIGLESGTDRYKRLKDVYPGELLNVVVTDRDGEIECWDDAKAGVLMLKGAIEMLSSGKVKWLNLEVMKDAYAEGWLIAEQIYGFLDGYGFEPNIPLPTKNHKTKHKDMVFVPKLIVDRR